MSVVLDTRGMLVEHVSLRKVHTLSSKEPGELGVLASRSTSSAGTESWISRSDGDCPPGLLPPALPRVAPHDEGRDAGREAPK